LMNLLMKMMGLHGSVSLYQHLPVSIDVK
jgi:hypothetical protein